MILRTLDKSPGKPVSHDPSLIKKLLVDEGVLPGITGISHISLTAGSNVDMHVHDNGYEVFYCIDGNAVAVVGDKRLNIEAGSCLIVEPGEPHGFGEIQTDTGLLYFFLLKPH